MSRVLPHSVETEKDLLGAMLSSDTALEEGLVSGDTKFFYLETHQKIFQAMRELRNQGEPVNAISLVTYLEGQHSWPSTRSDTARSYVVALIANTVNSRVITSALKRVRADWGKRECIRLFTAPLSGAWNGATPEQVLTQVEQVCHALRTQLDYDGDTRLVNSFQLATILEADLKQKTEQRGVPTCFSWLPPMFPGRLYVLGGYAKDGKTVLAVQMLRAALKAGRRVGFVSIEMSALDLGHRIIASYGVPYRQVLDRDVEPAFRSRWEQAIADIAICPADVIDNPGIDLAGIERAQKLGRYDLLIVDHLHRINYEDAYNPRSKLNGIVKGIARLARQENVPVLLLAQLHRPQSQDGFPRPTMQSFKETSTIEQEASALWAIYRRRDERGARTMDAEFMVLADRYGEDLRRPLLFLGQSVRFSEVKAL